AASTPRAACRASLSMCMLHGVTMLQVDATPTCGFLKSPSVNPTACSIARLAARSGPSISPAEWQRASQPAQDFSARDFVMGISVNGLLIRPLTTKYLSFVECFGYVQPMNSRSIVLALLAAA